MKWHLYEWSEGFSIRSLRREPASLPFVEEVFSRVAAEGDEALLAYTRLWDGVSLARLRVPVQEIESARVSPSLAAAIERAYANIYSFHSLQRPKEIVTETEEGVLCGLRYVPIRRVGLYIPGGTAPLFSTVLMLGVPAQIAGVPSVAMAMPPSPSGTVHPAVLYAARLCGISEIYTVGGAQAIAAFAIGTATIPAVDKIFGPGNRYVQAAKLEAVRRGVAIDMPAGPSEVVIVTDETALPLWVAADLIAQAEHGPDSLVGLVSPSRELIQQVSESLYQQVSMHPRRRFIESSLEGSWALWVPDMDTALTVVEEVAPEHLILACKSPESWLSRLHRVGSVFLGPLTPESAGDYASGTNHVLPTGGAARGYSSLTVLSFLRSFTYQRLTLEGVRSLSPTVISMAEAEELPAHAQAMKLRYASL
ncbi:MAG: histidinol dehydrogenase [Bacteroidia bacterium]|nr:histidinol dehydrogenase [Bacteroidia bacterium]